MALTCLSSKTEPKENDAKMNGVKILALRNGFQVTGAKYHGINRNGPQNGLRQHEWSQ